METDRCSQRRDVERPTCAIHDVALEERKIPIDRYCHGLGSVQCLVCPTTGHPVFKPDPMKRPPARSPLRCVV
jgi:hypothetical protein